MARILCAACQFCPVCFADEGWYRACFQSTLDRPNMSEHTRIMRGCEFGPAIRRQEANCGKTARRAWCETSSPLSDMDGTPNYSNLHIEEPLPVSPSHEQPQT